MKISIEITRQEVTALAVITFSALLSYANEAISLDFVMYPFLNQIGILGF